jgi:hypothetical protein
MDDKEFLEQVLSCTLPLKEWTHRAHVKFAFLCLKTASFDDALIKLRNGIQAYNSAHRVEESPTSGYNETTTRAFLHLVASTMYFYGTTFPTPDSDSFCDAHPQLMNRYILRLFYSPEQRMHRDAKASFVEPDLAPLPLLYRNQSSSGLI